MSLDELFVCSSLQKTEGVRPFGSGALIWSSFEMSDMCSGNQTWIFYKINSALNCSGFIGHANLIWTGNQRFGQMLNGENSRPKMVTKLCIQEIMLHTNISLGQHTYFIKLGNLNASIGRKKEGIILLENR